MPALRLQARTILKTRFIDHGIEEILPFLVVHRFNDSSHLVAFLRFAFLYFGNPGQRFLGGVLPFGTVLLQVTYLLAFEAPPFLFKFVVFRGPCVSLSSGGSINFHWYDVVLFLFQGTLEAVVPFALSSLAKCVPFLSERFFNYSESAHFSVGGFFPFVNGDRPSISPKDGGEDTVFQSVLELFDGSYFRSWNFTSAEKILKARDVIIDKVAIHFQFSQVGTGFFQSSGVGIIILEGLLEIFPEIFVVLCDWVTAS